MRGILAIALLLVAASGCMDSPVGAFGHARQDCSSSQQTIASTRADVLMPAAMPGSARDSFGPPAKVSVVARDGQMLVAAASWAPTAGEVEVLFDGPGSNEASTDNAWVSTGEVEAGEYTLELVGDPMAVQVTYTLHISAAGCTPIEA